MKGIEIAKKLNISTSALGIMNHGDLYPKLREQKMATASIQVSMRHILNVYVH